MSVCTSMRRSFERGDPIGTIGGTVASDPVRSRRAGTNDEPLRPMTGDRGRPAAPFEHLWSAPAASTPGAERLTSRGMPMPDELRARYGGPLEIPMRPGRQTILVNFVATIDGIVALGPGEPAGGGVISGFFEPDRFVMALLRSIADVLLVGARTIAGSSSGDWTAEHLQPDLAPAIQGWRRDARPRAASAHGHRHRQRGRPARSARLR